MIMCFIVSFTLSNCTQKLADAQKEGGRESGRRRERERGREFPSTAVCTYYVYFDTRTDVASIVH